MDTNDHPTDYYLKLIRLQKAYAELLIKNCEPIAAEVVTYQSNANCSCKVKLQTYINSNKELVKQVYSQFVAENPAFVPEKPEENIAGRVIEIEADPVKYQKLIEFLKENNQTYKGLNIMDVVKETTSGPKTVWLVFFY